MTVASAPASSANLGPGFDILALALDMRCRVTAEPADSWEVVSDGEPASEATVGMVRSVAGDVDPHRVQIDSPIPQAAGLGSSAALLVATKAAVDGDVDDRDDLYRAAVATEGHPDNVGAAVFGGLVAAMPDGVERLAVHPDLHVVVAVPDEHLATAEARAALSDQVDRSVAVRTATRLVMLVEGLRTADPVSFAAALGDEMHEEPRRSLTSTPGRLIDIAVAAGAVYAAWSGAGPSVIAFCTRDLTGVVRDELQSVLGDGGEVLELGIDRDGVRIEDAPAP